MVENLFYLVNQQAADATIGNPAIAGFVLLYELFFIFIGLYYISVTTAI
jgi:hypothetical protein